MSEKKNLFSDVALASLTSSRDVDVVTDVSNHGTTCFLVSVTLMVFGVVYWGLFGTIVDNVNAFGMTVEVAGISSILAHGDGIIDNSSLMAGKRVFRNQIVGRLYNSTDLFRLRQIEIELKQLIEQIKELEKGNADLVKFRLLAEIEKEKAISSLLGKQKEASQRQLELAMIYEKLIDGGSTSVAEYYRILDQKQYSDMTTTNIFLDSIDAEISQKNILWRNRMDQIALVREQKQKENEYELLTRQYEENIWLRSLEDGVIVEVLKGVGDPVKMGDRVALVSNDTLRDLKLVAFVPVERGKRIKPGMRAFFSPNSFRAKDYGYIECVVIKVDPFSISADAIKSEFKNNDLAEKLTENSLLMRLEVELVPDSEIPGHFKWTSKHGKNAIVDAGTMGIVTINTEYRSPISFVIPYFRMKLLGVTQ